MAFCVSSDYSTFLNSYFDIVKITRFFNWETYRRIFSIIVIVSILVQFYCVPSSVII